MTAIVTTPNITPYLRRCEKCHKSFKKLYPVVIGDHTFNLCERQCITSAQEEWKAKQDIGYTNPDLPINLQNPIEETTDEKLIEEYES